MEQKWWRMKISKVVAVLLMLLLVVADFNAVYYLTAALNYPDDGLVFLGTLGLAALVTINYYAVTKLVRRLHLG
jgi:hypothetical protein